jgi:hypothetical protein
LLSVRAENLDTCGQEEAEAEATAKFMEDWDQMIREKPLGIRDRIRKVLTDPDNDSERAEVRLEAVKGNDSRHAASRKIETAGAGRVADSAGAYPAASSVGHWSQPPRLMSHNRPARSRSRCRSACRGYRRAWMPRAFA